MSKQPSLPVNLSLAVVLTALLGACAPATEFQEPEPEVSEDVKSTAKGIIDGVVDYGHKTVGLVYPSGCSSNLVGRRTVVTAAHCVDYHGQRGTYCSEGTCVGGTYYINPWWNPDNLHYDMAVLVLDQDFTAMTGIIPSRVANSRPYNGWRINLVGYGCTEWKTSTGYGTKRQGWNTIDEVNSNEYQFDGSGGQSRICQGDSGGPSFRDAAGMHDCQIGVHSHRQGFWEGADDMDHRLDTTFNWLRSFTGDSSVLACGQTSCGDGICHSNEGYNACPTDCPAVCGNGVCEGSEQDTCPGDCPTCGNGICESGESGQCSDCATCGNGICESDEDGWCSDCGGTCVSPPCPVY